MARKEVVTKKPTIWDGASFTGTVLFPETYKEAEEMGYSEEFVMDAFRANQRIRIQAVIDSFVGKPEDYEDGHIPTDEEVQAHLDEYDFTTVRRAMTTTEKVVKAASGASQRDIAEMIAALQAQLEEVTQG